MPLGGYSICCHKSLYFNSPLECNFATKVKPVKIKSSKYTATTAYFSVQKEEIIPLLELHLQRKSMCYKEIEKQESK